MKVTKQLFPKTNSIDWNALTDAEFAKRIAVLKREQRAIFEKPVADLNNEEMMEAVKAGRFDKRQ